MAKIGIGVTSYNRPECLKECLQHICDYSDVGALDGMSKKDYWFGRTSDGKDITIYAATDTDEDRRGVAFRKNECLRALKDCDYVFLFDDDCFPIKDGWVDYFITHSGGAHLLYLNEQHNLTMRLGNCEIYSDCGGVFMFMTKEHIENVGAFNEKFKLWGFEHAEYSMRINMQRQFFSLNRTSDYIFAHDYSTKGHCSSISNEEKKRLFNENFPKFKEPIKNIYIPL